MNEWVKTFPESCSILHDLFESNPIKIEVSNNWYIVNNLCVKCLSKPFYSRLLFGKKFNIDKY